ncbi:DUF4870 family protein [Pelomicrobium sp. G1]|uniref:DUF4870 family protein n=1 Tax=unclassified Pelomicrobium TaxID=2815318 RepID=UPI0021DECE2A|nr:MAG: membrane protein [Burkholderiales bacterium]
MTEIDARTGTLAPSDSLVRLTHVIYALHAFSAVTGLVGAAFVVTAFLTGWPSIIAVIINYVKRPDVRGSYLESHFRWQIRTFWFALLWVLVALLLWATLLGIPLALAILLITGLWVLYRIIRGWLRLVDRKPMPL